MPKKDYSSYSKEELISIIRDYETRKKFGLVWDYERNIEDVVKNCRENFPVLKDVSNLNINDENSDINHILIEGDNYHAISVLNYTHQNLIDVIYIDPPYNTGSRDWKYNNNYVDNNDTYRHSKWLSFMKNRIQIAKNLLKPTGIFICAIDENEQERLGLLLDDIFPSHQKTCVTVIHNPGGVQGDNFSYCHEYVYFVFPSKGKYIGTKPREDGKVTPFRDWGGDESTRLSGANSFYPILIRNEKIIGFGDVCKSDFYPKSANIKNSDGSISIFPIDGNSIERKWRFSRNSVESIKGELFVEKVKSEYVIKRKKINYRYKTVWTDKKYNSNAYGSAMLNKIINNQFPFPKSLYNVEECLNAVIKDNKNAIVFDFFAGSGTTAHALLEMNKKDGGNRRFIICTNNEGNICEDVCYPRVNNIIKGYTARGSMRFLIYEEKLTISSLKSISKILKKIDNLKLKNNKKYNDFKIELDNNIIQLYGIVKKDNKVLGHGGNLKYFKTSFVPASSTDFNKKIIMENSIQMICLKEDTFDLHEEGDCFKVYKNKNQFTAILYDDLKIDLLKDILRNLKMPIHIYIFSLSDDDFYEDFSDLENSINICSVPSALLNIYKRIFK